MNMRQHNLKMPIDLLQRFKALADEEQTKVSKLIRQSMELYLSEKRQTSIKTEDTIFMDLTLKLAKLINREDVHSICLINGICSELWNAYLVKIGYSVHPEDILHSAQQILGCGLSLEEVYDDRHKVVNDYTEYYIKIYLQ
jgi:CxxC motif-containing protein